MFLELLVFGILVDISGIYFKYVMLNVNLIVF